jgi:hypothetical protein
MAKKDIDIYELREQLKEAISTALSVEGAMMKLMQGDDSIFDDTLDSTLEAYIDSLDED